METGKVKFWNRNRKFGFIVMEDGSEIFFHLSGIKDATPPDEDDIVEFRIVPGKRGKTQAVDVHVVEGHIQEASDEIQESDG